MTRKITVADLFPHDIGMILVAKDILDASSRHISEVANGAACGCECFGCGRRLVARNGGDVRAHSFAHHPEDMVTDCFSSGETALHLRAKEIIARHRRITLPPTSVLDLEGSIIEVTPERSVDLTDIAVEMVAGEVIPDIAATMTDGRRIFIEIANTHVCSPEKVDKLGAMGVDVLEIMVSDYRDVPLDELDEIILDTALRKLIHCAEVKAKEAEIAEVRLQQEEAKRVEAQRLVDVYRDPTIHNDAKAEARAAEFAELGLSAYFDCTGVNPSAFSVSRRQWQAAVLGWLYGSASAFVTPIDLLERFAREGWPKQEIAHVPSEYSRWITANVAEDFRSPHEEVLDYLHRLVALGAVYEVDGMGFAMSHNLFNVISAAIEKRDRPQRRTRELKTFFRDIGFFMTVEDGQMPDFDDWLRGRALAARLSVEQLLDDTSGKYAALADAVRTVTKAIVAMKAYKQVEPPTDTAGLPIGSMINRLMAAVAERDSRERAERAARLQHQRAQEADDRVSTLFKEATYVVDDAEAFMRTPLTDGCGRTPHELAAEGYEGLNQVLAVLCAVRKANDDARELERARFKWVDEFRDRVYRSIPNRDRAELWLKQSNRELGWAKPLDFCKDKKTQALCFEVLDRFVASEKKRGRR